MKKTKTILAGCLLAGVLAVATNSQAVGYGDSAYVGYFDPGVPSDLSDELGFVNYLVTNLGPGDTGPDQTYGNNNSKTRDYDRQGSTLTGLPTATGGTNIGTTGTTVDASGVKYLLAKYGTRSFVWYSATGFDDEESLPTTLNGNGLSHSDGFNEFDVPPPPGGGGGVPDSGATMVLFGAGLLGVGALRRRLNK